MTPLQRMGELSHWHALFGNAPLRKGRHEVACVRVSEAYAPVEIQTETLPEIGQVGAKPAIYVMPAYVAHVLFEGFAFYELV